MLPGCSYCFIKSVNQIAEYGLHICVILLTNTLLFTKFINIYKYITLDKYITQTNIYDSLQTHYF